VQAALLVYFGSFPSHFHQDELETAYASYKLPPFSEIDWLGPYPHTDAWVAKFPIPFFALQAPFLKLLGPSIESVRLSTWPYQALTVLYLYLLARRLLADRLLAAAAVLLYLLFAPALYLGSLGVHFHSSTLFLLATLYHAAVLVDRPGRLHAAALGLFAAAW
jgi:4-amino-4-deoxy-L-arabinose transferase-like glycosyltransferase